MPALQDWAGARSENERTVRCKGWIRRLRDKPDAIITEGQTTVLKSVETNRKLVAH